MSMYTKAMDYFVVGLGNPGSKYEKTRHNVAWIVLNEIYSFQWDYDKYLKAYYSSDIQSSIRIHYILPQTFMNKSGESIAGLSKMFSSFSPERLIVIYDDIDLPLGVIKISFNRGAGGHNGLRSIIEHLGSKKCIRIRIGISRTLEDGRIIKAPVLGTFERSELQKVTGDISSELKRILQSIISEGYQKTMNIFNVRK